MCMAAKKARDDLIAASATVSRCGQGENSAIPLYKLVLFMVYSPALLNARTDATTTIGVCGRRAMILLNDRSYRG
jgi:hypothetical protein